MLRTIKMGLALATVALAVTFGAGCSGNKPDGYLTGAPYESPIITSTAQSNADGIVIPDGVYTLRVDATDPQNQPLTFAWAATAGEFTPSTTTFTTASPGSSQIGWRAPATLAAVMDVSVSVTDGTPAPARPYVFHFHSSDACGGLADGAACTINACIDGSTCLSHVCQGGTPKVPPALSACQAAATCDPNTGAFTRVNKPDNTSCSTGNLCQVGEVCVAGVCGGGSAVICPQPASSCMAAGACVPATGCPTPTPLPSGTVCTGADKCLQSYACDASGQCVGSSPVQCNASTNPCVADAVCQPETGACVGANLSDGTPCATDSCRTGMTCTAGQCSGGSSTCAAPAAPTAVTASAGDAHNTVLVAFTAPTSPPNSPILSYTVISNPTGVTGTGSGSPISVTCSSSCVGYAFAVFGTNSSGDGVASDLVHVVTTYDVTETFYEPETQPNNTIFTGSFTLDSTSSTISNLKGSLTESMTNLPPAAGSEMDVVPLVYQLSDVSDGQGRHLVTVFALNTTDTFWKGGFAPGSGKGIYFGFPDAINPSDPGGVGNAYAMLNISISEPTAALTQAQIDLLAYADCTALGMMGVTCMTGTTVAGYGTIGTMKGYPVSQVVTKR